MAGFWRPPSGRRPGADAPPRYATVPSLGRYDY